MTTKYCFFKICAPLASFGEFSFDEIRDTDKYPTKSSIMGLVGGALGIDRKNIQDLRELYKYSFAVIVNNYGKVMRDYHIVQCGKNINLNSTRKDELLSGDIESIQTYRYYRENSEYIIALWENKISKYSLEDISHALQYPVYVPYIGRKSCTLSAPMAPEIIIGNSFTDTFKNTKFYNLFDKNNSIELYYDADANIDGIDVIQEIERNDMLGNVKRSFNVRKEKKGLITCI